MIQPNPPKTVLANSVSLILNYQGETQSFNLNNPFHRLGRDPKQVDLLVPSHWNVVGRFQAIIKRVGSDYFIYDGDGNTPSSNRIFFHNTLITPQQGFKLENGVELSIGQNPNNWVTITYFDPHSKTSVTVSQKQTVSLTKLPISVGRDPTMNFILDHPIVSRQHSIVDRTAQGEYYIKDFSTNGIYVNGQKVQGVMNIKTGDKIRIGPYTLLLSGDQLTLEDQGQYIRLDATNITRLVKNKQGKSVCLLNDISLPIEPGQFVALVGGSGAGKSTLMRTLLGIDPTTSGIVYLNGEDLRTNFNIYRSQIGYVPQSDIIHKDLRVREVLTYAAQLRLPPDTDINTVVDKTLDQIDMKQRQDVLVKSLSGGQLKRVSIGVELLADPKLFFLDEPTSGLDPGLDKKMMLLLRKLANEGRTIILVTHATNNINQCDRIVFLGFGGNLCYFGKPEEALGFFKINQGDFADIYIHLDPPDTVLQERENFLHSPHYQNYISNCLITGQTPQTISPPKPVQPSFIRQLIILTKRYFQLILRDPLYLILSLIPAPVGIAIVSFLNREKTPFILGNEADPSLAPTALRVLFVFTSACLWVGFSSSLQEIVKEADIYIRERLVNLGLFAYLGSKLIPLGGLALVQTLLITLCILIGFDDAKGEVFSWNLGIIITTFLTLFSCMSLGLMVSSMAKNSTQASGWLPLLLLPQIILSGVLFNLAGAEIASWLMLSRWSVGAYGILVDVNGLVPDIPNKDSLPFSGSDVYTASGGNLALNWMMLILHSLVYLGVTLWLQKRKDIL